MKIVLVKKYDPSDFQPLLVQYVTTNLKGQEVKVTESVAIGQSLDLDDDTAYAVMGKYKGLFKPEGYEGKMSETAKGHAHKAINAPTATKAAQPEAK